MALPSDEIARERPRAMLRLALLGLLVVTPLPFGSVQATPLLVLELWAAAVGALATYLAWRDGLVLGAVARICLATTAVVVAIGVLQLVPMPESWIEMVAGPTAAARGRVAEVLPETAAGARPLSLAPPATVDALVRFVAYAFVAFAARVAFRRGRHLRQAAVVIAACGAFQALYGAAEYLSGHQHIFWYAKRHHLDEATGTFINRNHFAAYLALTLPFAMGLALWGLRASGSGRSWRERLLRLAEPRGAVALLGVAAVPAIWLGVLFSYSRGGMAAALAGLGCITALGVSRPRRALVVAALIALPTLALLWTEVRAPGERFFVDRQELVQVGGRVPVWRATLEMIGDYPLVGAGLGTFEQTFPRYQPPQARKVWNHAHNDWLQSFAEGGVLVGLALPTVLVAVVGLGVRRRTVRRRGDDEPLGFCAAAGLVAIALHAAVDFPLRIPAIGVLTAAVVGLGCATGDDRRELAS